jgi:hypothetical protein
MTTKSTTGMSHSDRMAKAAEQLDLYIIDRISVGRAGVDDPEQRLNAAEIKAFRDRMKDIEQGAPASRENTGKIKIALDSLSDLGYGDTG